MKAVVVITLLMVVMVHGHRRREEHGFFKHHRGPPPPPFVRELSYGAQREYFKISSNTSATIAEQKEQIKDWAKRYNVTEKLELFEAEMTKMGKDVKTKVTQLIANLSALHNSFSEIMENTTQTPIQLRKALRDLRDKNPQAFHVLMYIHHVLKPRHGRRGPHGGRPFGPIGRPFNPNGLFDHRDFGGMWDQRRPRGPFDPNHDMFGSFDPSERHGFGGSWNNGRPGRPFTPNNQDFGFDDRANKLGFKDKWENRKPRGPYGPHNGQFGNNDGYFDDREVNGGQGRFGFRRVSGEWQDQNGIRRRFE